MPAPPYYSPPLSAGQAHGETETFLFYFDFKISSSFLCENLPQIQICSTGVKSPSSSWPAFLCPPLLNYQVFSHENLAYLQLNHRLKTLQFTYTTALTSSRLSDCKFPLLTLNPTPTPFPIPALMPAPAPSLSLTPTSSPDPAPSPSLTPTSFPAPAPSPSLTPTSSPAPTSSLYLL